MPFGWWFNASSQPASSKKEDTSSIAKSSVFLMTWLILGPLNPEGVKPCCACPLTKQKRDDCFMNSINGEVECKDLIQAHKEYELARLWLIGRCMASFGFKV